VSVREDGYDFALKFGLGLIRLMRPASNNEIDDERGGNSNKHCERRRFSC
jgi:hypothetical protein